MFMQFIIKFLKTSKMLPIIKISLIISVTSFNLAIMPRRSWWNKLKATPHNCQTSKNMI